MVSSKTLISIFSIFVFIQVAHAVLQISFGDQEQLTAAQQAHFNGGSHCGWVLLNYDGNSDTKVVFAGAGSGSAAEFQAQLSDNKIQFGVVRIPQTKTGGKDNATYECHRDVFINWKGKGVNVILRGKQAFSTNVDDAKEILRPIHAALTIENKSEITDDNLIALSDPQAGTHVANSPYTVVPLENFQTIS